MAACGTVGALAGPALASDVLADDAKWLMRRIQEGIRTGEPVVLTPGSYVLRSDVVVRLSKGSQLSLRGQTGSAEDVLLDLLPTGGAGDAPWPRMTVQGTADSALELRHLTIRGPDQPGSRVGERGLHVDGCGVVTLRDCLFLDSAGLDPTAIPGVVRFSSIAGPDGSVAPHPKQASPTWR